MHNKIKTDKSSSSHPTLENVKMAQEKQESNKAPSDQISTYKIRRQIHRTLPTPIKQLRVYERMKNFLRNGSKMSYIFPLVDKERRDFAAKNREEYSYCEHPLKLNF